MAACRWCGAPVVFVRMADSGRLMPCNPGADARGNVLCRKRGPLYTDGRVVTSPDDTGDLLLLLAHWATCTSPDAARRRERKTPERAQPGLF